MLLVTDAFPIGVAERLLQFNIRFVEQFLSMMRERSAERSLAEALGYSIEDLESLAQAIRARHPELVLPEPKERPYGLGLELP